LKHIHIKNTHSLQMMSEKYRLRWKRANERV